VARRPLLGDAAFALALTAAYGTLIFWGLQYHHMWVDELQAWMIARDSNSLSDLHRNLRYEGHPPLWHLLLFVVSRFDRNPSAMQPLHALLAMASVYLVVRFAPFSRTQKCLFVLGYYPLYEYSLRSRCYVLGMLFLAAYAAFARPDLRYWRRQALCAGLMGWTSVCGMILGAAALSALAMQLLQQRAKATDRRRADAPPSVRAALSSRDLVTLGGAATILAVAFLVTLPPHDVHLAYGAKDTLPHRLLSGLSISAYAAVSTVVPLWAAGLAPGGVPWVPIAWIVGAALFLAACVGLSRSRPAVVLIVLTFAGLAVIGTEYMPHPRHLGTGYLALLGAFWLVLLQPSAPGDPPTSAGWLARLRTDGAVRTLLTVILALQAVAGIAYYVRDRVVPLSRAGDAAAFIRDNGYDRLPMIGCLEEYVASMSGYLDRPIYYPQSAAERTFIVWREGAIVPIQYSALMAAVHDYVAQHGQTLLILNGPIKHPDTDVPDVALREVGTFRGADPETHEDYNLYIATYRGSRPEAVPDLMAR
jgi:hypothetical protein